MITTLPTTSVSNNNTNISGSVSTSSREQLTDTRVERNVVSGDGDKQQQQRKHRNKLQQKHHKKEKKQQNHQKQEEEKVKDEAEEEEEKEEVIAVPLWQDPIKLPPPPMECIPEDEEGEAVVWGGGSDAVSASTSLMAQCSQSQQKSSYGITSPMGAAKLSPTSGLPREIKQRRREIYRTEEIDTLVSTLPKEVIPHEWENLSSEQIVVDPKMAHTYLTELPGGLPPTARGNKYSYTYESRLEDGDDVEEMEEMGKNTSLPPFLLQQQKQQFENGERRGEEEIGVVGGIGSGGDEGLLAMPAAASAVGEWRRPNGVEQSRTEHEERDLGEQVLTDEDGVERRCTSTQKITRITKITTTRSVKQFPVEAGDLFFDSEGNPILNGFDAKALSPSPSQPPFVSVHSPPSTAEDDEEFVAVHGSTRSGGILDDPSVGINLVNGERAAQRHRQQGGSNSSSTSKQVSPQSFSETTREEDAKFCGATPSAPGPLEIAESVGEILVVDGCDTNPPIISLFWQPPDFEGTAGPLIGYRVEFRRSELEEWEPAHDDLLGETECKITNLDPEEHYQFRVLGANIAGFGLPSDACAPLRLRTESTQFGTEPTAAATTITSSSPEALPIPPPPPPLPPSRPRVIVIDSDRATIEWQPHPQTTIEQQFDATENGVGISESPNGRRQMLGYLVQFHEAGTSSWMPANDRPVSENYFQVHGLRPNGEYEFRVVARDANGRDSVASLSSGFVRIRPPAPARQPSSGTTIQKVASDVAEVSSQQPPDPPSEPRLLESGPNWLHLQWDPPAASTSANFSTTIRGAPSLAYLVEMRELGEPTWRSLMTRGRRRAETDGGAENFTTMDDHFIVENLAPESAGYEFRVWSVCLSSALLSPRPSPISEPIRLRPPQAARTQTQKTKTTSTEWASSHLIGAGPSSVVGNRKVPERPSAPEYLEVLSNSLTLCWQPARSSLPVHGYELEFRDPMQDAINWYRLTTDQLVRACKTSIGSLLCGHQYQFRVLARNAVGLSQPSDPSPLVTIGGTLGEQLGPGEDSSKPQQMPLMEEMTLVRESPPLPDRDDSPPPIYRQTHSSLQWRDPTLKEVIDYLKSPDPSLVLDASGYLQHLTFNNDLIKEETRNYGGVECLISLLRSSNPEILRNVCGCLKNLTFGKANDANKRLLNQKGGLKALAQILRSNQNALVHEEATGALWNISSADDLKEPVLNQTAEAVVGHVVLPYSGLLHHSPQPVAPPPSATLQFSPSSSQQQTTIGRNPATIVFRNGTGILRNISAVNDQARRFLRSAPGLVEALLHFLQGAAQRKQLDTRSTENVACLLRNLSYRVQEVVDPKYDPNRSRYQMRGSADPRKPVSANGLHSPAARSAERSKSAPSGSPKTDLSSTTARKAGGGGGRFFRRRKKSEMELSTETLQVPPASGPHLLWHPSTVRLYLRVLEESANCEILEASAAAIQNLAGCPFQGSALVRQTVRVEKGLPVLVELLRLCEDRVVCAVCCALRNLALDQRNLELIGRFALTDLLAKLPQPERTPMETAGENAPSDATLGAILGILWEVVRHSSELARAVHETADGTERLRALAKCYPVYGRRVCKYATQVLYMMWQHKDLHELFRELGLNESDFYSGTVHRGMSKTASRELLQRQQSGGAIEKHSPSSVATTLARPFSSQGLERPAHLALARGADTNSSHYDASFSIPPPSQQQQQQIRAIATFPSSSSSTPVPPKPPLRYLAQQQQRNGHHHFQQTASPLSVSDQLYAAVQKGEGNLVGVQDQQQKHVPQQHQKQQQHRRQSIDSWV